MQINFDVQEYTSNVYLQSYSFISFFEKHKSKIKSIMTLYFNFQRPSNCTVNIFKFDKEESESVEYQCIDIDLICSQRTNLCESSDLITLGNRIVIHKGTPIICGSELIGLLSEAFYEKGYIVVDGINNFDERDLVQYKPEVKISRPRVHVYGYQSLRTAI